MSKKAAKAEYKRLIEECRELWNEFDPIGVLENADWPRDEYDSYLPHTVSLVRSGADTYKLAAYVRNIVHVSMGLTGFREPEIIEFAERLRRRLGG